MPRYDQWTTPSLQRAIARLEKTEEWETAEDLRQIVASRKMKAAIDRQRATS